MDESIIICFMRSAKHFLAGLSGENKSYLMKGSDEKHVTIILQKLRITRKKS